MLCVKFTLQSDESKMKYQNQLAEVNNDLGAVRKELLHTEQNRLDLETEKMALVERSKFLESEKEKVNYIFLTVKNNLFRRKTPNSEVHFSDFVNISFKIFILKK